MKTRHKISLWVGLSLFIGVLSAPVLAVGAPDGKAIMESRCGECHSVERIVNAKKDRGGWETTVARMMANGASLNSEEKATLIDYLVSK